MQLDFALTFSFFFLGVNLQDSPPPKKRRKTASGVVVCLECFFPPEPPLPSPESLSTVHKATFVRPLFKNHIPVAGRSPRWKSQARNHRLQSCLGLVNSYDYVLEVYSCSFLRLSWPLFFFFFYQVALSHREKYSPLHKIPTPDRSGSPMWRFFFLATIQ